jgi:hypothetical protein
VSDIALPCPCAVSIAALTRLLLGVSHRPTPLVAWCQTSPYPARCVVSDTALPRPLLGVSHRLPRMAWYQSPPYSARCVVSIAALSELALVSITASNPARCLGVSHRLNPPVAWGQSLPYLAVALVSDTALPRPLRGVNRRLIRISLGVSHRLSRMTWCQTPPYPTPRPLRVSVTVSNHARYEVV